MFRPIKALFTIAVLAWSVAAWSAAAPGDPPARVARLSYAAGTVSFAPYEAPDAWTQAVLNRPLTSGDRLWADQNGRAELHAGSTAVRLGALTSADILNLDDDILQLRLAQGSLNVRVRELDADDVVEIATPAGAVLLRQPGSYRISADPSGGFARVLVNFGQAEVITPTHRYTVPSSQAATFSAAGGPASFEVAAYAAGDEFDQWAADRDRREDRSESARYVSRDMPGYQDLDTYGAWRTLPEYGAVWVPTRVAPDWAPFRHGHWAWVSPWGWTWVDDAPWGFAPSHYGRWVYHHNYWAWAPGRMVRRPVYAPAVVAFVGGSNFSVSVRSGPAVGWFPLGWREPYIPWYRASHNHVRNVNVTHVTNVTNITNVTNVRYVNRERPNAVTVVPRQAFVSARPVAQSNVRVSREEIARAEVVREQRQPAEPTRASVAPERPGHRPPTTAAAREVVSVNAPATAAGQDRPAWRERPAFSKGDDAEPRVRVLRGDRERERDRDRGQAAQEPARAPATAVAPAQPAAPTATAPAPATSVTATPAPRAPAAEAPKPPAAAVAPAARAPATPEAPKPPPTATAPAAPPAAVTRTPAAEAPKPPAAAAPPTAPSAVVTRTPQRAPDADRAAERRERVERRDGTDERREAVIERRDNANERRQAIIERRERAQEPAPAPRAAPPARLDATPGRPEAPRRSESPPAREFRSEPPRPQAQAPGQPQPESRQERRAAEPPRSTERPAGPPSGTGSRRTTD